MTPPILYSFRRCPYAMRARMALVAAEQEVELREIVLRDKPAPMLEASPKGTVPVLVRSDAPVLEESLDVMLWALGKHDPDLWLTPPNGTKEDMLALVHTMDGDFKTHLDRYKYANRHAADEETSARISSENREAGMEILMQLDERLAIQSHLFGNRACLADIAIAPFVRQFANTDRAWFDKQPCPHLHRWLNTFLESDLFNSVMDKLPPWKEGDDVITFPFAHSA